MNVCVSHPQSELLGWSTRVICSLAIAGVCAVIIRHNKPNMAVTTPASSIIVDPNI